MIAKTKSKATRTIPAAGYIRMSSDSQEDSPARQKMLLTGLAQRLGRHIVRWYEDLGKSGTESTAREAFQQLLHDAKSGAFSTVLLAEQSRFSREDVLDLFDHVRTLRNAGVELATVQRGIIDPSDLASLLLLLIEGHGARKESMNIAERSVTGKRLRISRNERIGGLRVFGYDREVVNASGEVVIRVSFRDQFKAPSGLKSRLVLSSERKAVETVRFMFAKILEGWGTAQLCRELNRRGVYLRNPRNWGRRGVKQAQWRIAQVHNILRNPAYCGDTDVNSLRALQHTATPKFFRVSDEPVLLRDTHPAIIDRRDFEMVQSLLQVRGKTWRGRPRKVDGVSSIYLLSGLVRCEHCGQKAFGGILSKLSENPYYYRCRGRNPSVPSAETCKHQLLVRASELEPIVLDIITKHVTAKCADGLRAEHIARSTQTRPTAKLESMLSDVHLQIKKAERNLALCNAESIPVIEEAIRELRLEAQGITVRLEEIGHTVRLAPEAQQRIESMTASLAQVNSKSGLDRQKLNSALKTMVSAIYVRRFKPKGGVPTTVGRIVFREGLGLDEASFEVADNVAYKWHAVRDALAAAHPNSLTVKEIQTRTGIVDSGHAHEAALKCVEYGKAERLEFNERQFGKPWVAFTAKM